MASLNTLKQEFSDKPAFGEWARSRLVYFAPLAAVILLGVFLRFLDLGTESYWFDEIVMVDRVSQDPGTLLQLDRPGYVLLAHFWQQLFGTAEFATRALSAVLGTGALVLLYAVGRQVFNHWVAVIATFLMAVSEFQIFYSQDYRYYSLMVFASLASFLFMLRALEHRRVVDWGLYALAIVMLIYTHMFGIFILAAQNAYIVLRARKHRASLLIWLAVQGLIGLVIARIIFPPVANASTGNLSSLPWIPERPLWYLPRTLYRYLFPLPYEPTWTAVAGNVAAGALFVTAGSLVYALSQGIGEWRRKLSGTVANRQLVSRDVGALLLLGCWLLIPLGLPFVLSKVIAPMFVDRYTIGAAPALYLLLAFAVVCLRGVIPLVVSLGALLVMIVPGLQQYYQVDVKEQWNETAAYVAAQEEPGDVVVFAPGEEGWLQASFNWYYRGQLQKCDLELGVVDQETIHQAVENCTVGQERFWLVLRGDKDRIRPFTDFFLERNHTDMKPVDEQQFTYISLYLFELSEQ